MPERLSSTCSASSAIRSRPAGARLQAAQHLVGGQRQPVGGLELGVELAHRARRGRGRARASAELGLAELLRGAGMAQDGSSRRASVVPMVVATAQRRCGAVVEPAAGRRGSANALRACAVGESRRSGAVGDGRSGRDGLPPALPARGLRRLDVAPPTVGDPASAARRVVGTVVSPASSLSRLHASLSSAAARSCRPPSAAPARLRVERLRRRRRRASAVVPASARRRVDRPGADAGTRLPEASTAPRGSA